MNLQNPKKFKMLIDQAHESALNVLRPISRKYDKAEHSYPKELDMFASLIDGMNDGGEGINAGAAVGKRGNTETGNKNGVNMSTVLGVIEMCYGDTGLLLSMPRQGLGNSAIAAVANDEQLVRFKGTWAAMAITEPGCGSDSAAIRTTAIKDGNDYILNGEKIFVTSGERADAVVVWATLDKKLGRAAIKSFVVPKGTPGMKVERLEHKLGIKASDTAVISFIDCRVPAENLLGHAEIDVAKGFAGVMETFDNTRPLVAAMAVGCAKASLERIKEIFKDQLDENYQIPYLQTSHIATQIYRMEAEWEAARLLTMKAAWMADNKKPNSREASISKAKAGRICNEITLKCVELAASVGYNEDELLEKWARDSKILDIFEGTQQIQQLIIARRELGKNSSELK
ncbi:acyl-CoA dehydrogenase family protein [Acinetobacter sp.]|uniref:acyl-CoA dehydrogenase family protein n=1 Tax=Acinetobacter sp. TaxID=472 RepID=UPI00264765EC|nr:acyl-CoA dehydrogenase family protein [Acinetobacter sp.]MDN5513348.1 acyl-CoA dehydrogenase family protein [Acinetobacter sp.]MDN5525101.1 acyl-CoA dehydrogenase family protein [Acinetobacter sp.]